MPLSQCVKIKQNCVAKKADSKGETVQMYLIKKRNKQKACVSQVKTRVQKTKGNEEHKVHENESEVQHMKARSGEHKMKGDDELTQEQRNTRTTLTSN